MTAVTRRALPYVRYFKTVQAEYAESCEEWRRQGYIPHYCIHGRNLWVDHDVICGPCEDGPYNPYTEALMAAHADVAECRRRTDWLASAPSTLPPATRTALIDWAIEPITSEIG